MADSSKASVRWLTLAAWMSLVVFAASATLDSVSLKHIGTDLEIGYALKGALAPSRSVVLGLSTLLIGCLADRFGKRRFLGGGMLIVSLALLWIWRSSGYGGLVAGMMLLGAGLGSLEALASPLIAELHPDRVGTQMNVLHAFYPAGIVAASLLVGSALERGIQWRMPFAVAAIPAALVAVMFLCGRYPGSGAASGASVLRVGEVLVNRTFWLLAIAMALTAGCEGSLLFWSPNFIQDQYGVSALVGACGLMIFSSAMAVGRFGTGAAARFIRLERLMVVLAFVGALVTLVLTLAEDVWMNAVSLGLAGLCVACFWPSILTLATSRIGAGSARLLAMLSVAGLVGFGAMPWAVGMLAESFRLRVGLALVPAAMALAGIVLLKVARRS